MSESLLEHVDGHYYAVDTWVRLPRLLAAQGAQVTLWAPVRNGRVVPTGESWRVDLGDMRVEHHDPYARYGAYYRLWPRRVLAWRRRAARLIAAHDVVLVRLPSPMMSLVTALVNRAAKPLVLVVAGDSLAQSDRIRASRGLARLAYRWAVRWLVGQERRCARRASLVYAYSRELEERHHGSGVPVLRMRTPHLRLGDLVEREDTCGGDEVRLLRVCWLLPSKGIEPLLDAVALLRARGRRVRLEIVGKAREPGYLDTLRARARALALEGVVTFIGWVPFDRMREVYLRSDVQVISSYAEGTPRCIVEGAAHGVPLVSTAAGGCAEALEQERTALLVPVGDAPALAAAVERVVDDGDLRRSLIAEGYRLARGATFETIGVKLLDDLERLMRRADDDAVAARG
ncbi:MAG: hypothetical protein A2X36_02385 [Elusimicrobia bacterium GWA2_69_24]|nr:MAG: hypothetical protein A2W08_17125 [Candidatus Rokubacteria bacterium RBG_16_73_20]OGR60891.1 MAG: hypothetical protein A2X36_02385 [Elusimicrobia bacterium GWA2_69_24]HBH00763.1 hypothetical protein [Candidatus Rokubacteria bacterium]